MVYSLNNESNELYHLIIKLNPEITSELDEII